MFSDSLDVFRIPMTFPQSCTFPGPIVSRTSYLSPAVCSQLFYGVKFLRGFLLLPSSYVLTFFWMFRWFLRFFQRWRFQGPLISTVLDALGFIDQFPVSQVPGTFHFHARYVTLQGPWTSCCLVFQCSMFLGFWLWCFSASEIYIPRIPFLVNGLDYKIVSF